MPISTPDAGPLLAPRPGPLQARAREAPPRVRVDPSAAENGAKVQALKRGSRASYTRHIRKRELLAPCAT